MSAANLGFAVEEGAKHHRQLSCALQRCASREHTLVFRGILLVCPGTRHTRWCARLILRAAVCPWAPCRARLPRGLHLELAEALTVGDGGCMRNCSCGKLAGDCARRVRDGGEHQNARQSSHRDCPAGCARVTLHVIGSFPTNLTSRIPCFRPFTHSPYASALGRGSILRSAII